MAETLKESKVNFNLHNVYYAVIETDESGNDTYGAPKAIPGAVSLTLDPQGDSYEFYADGVVFYSSVKNNGYAGSLEVARFPDAMLDEVWGWTSDSNGVVAELTTTETKRIALLFQIDGDEADQLYNLLNVTLARPSIAAETTTATKEPKTQSIDLTAIATSAGRVMQRTTKNTPESVRNAWFTSVYTGV